MNLSMPVRISSVSRRTVPALVVFAVLSAAATARATVLFTENFESYATGALATGTGSNFATSTNSGTSAVTMVNTDGGNLFGGGTSNQYLQASALNGTVNEVVAAKTNIYSAQTGQFSFDLVAPTASSVSPVSSAYPTANSTSFKFRLGAAAANSYSAISLQFKSNGSTGELLTNDLGGTTFATLAFGSGYHVDIVFNNSLSSLSYAGGTVASGAFDLWVGGVLVGNDVAGNGGANIPLGTSISSFYITSNSTASVQTLYMDNIVVDSVATVGAIPEPSSVAILVGAVSMVAVLIVRRPRSVRPEHA